MAFSWAKKDVCKASELWARRTDTYTACCFFALHVMLIESGDAAVVIEADS